MKGKQKEITKSSENSPIILTYSIKRMRDICLLIDARVVLRWAVHSVKLASAKLQKRGQVNVWDPCSKLSGSTYPEILIFCVIWRALEVFVPDSGL